MSTSTKVPTHFNFPQSGLTSMQNITSHTSAVKSHTFDINDISLLVSNGTNCMYKVMKSFICRGCVNPATGTGCTSVDIGGDANLELVDKFCYLGDMLSVDGDDDAAVETRIRIGWNKFRHLVPLLTNKDMSLTVRGRLYSRTVPTGR